MAPNYALISCKRYPKLVGSFTPPPDKSITIRALILSSLSSGESLIRSPLISEGGLFVIKALEKLGATFLTDETMRVGSETIFRIRGISVRAKDNREKPSSSNSDVKELYLGGSATALRLLAGALCGLNGIFLLTGDKTLLNRPMERLTKPLVQMGASITFLKREGYAPLLITGSKLSGIDYTLEVPSAQVKSAVLLAGLFAEGKTSVTELLPARDHTERMLPLFNVYLEKEERQGRRTITLLGKQSLQSASFSVPGDFSSAFLPIALALILPDSFIRCEGVGLNKTRLGALRVLQSISANITVEVTGKYGNEEVGVISAKTSSLKAFEIDESEVGTMIDELPLLALIATQAEGESRIRGLSELKVKESDRAFGVFEILRAFGADVLLSDKELRIKGPKKLKPSGVKVPKDHRMAILAFACAVIAGGDSRIGGFSSAETFWPSFHQTFSDNLIQGVSILLSGEAR